MGITFTDWNNGTWDGGPAFTIDWTSAETLRGVPAAILMEAIRQAAVERFKQAVYSNSSTNNSNYYQLTLGSPSSWIGLSECDNPTLWNHGTGTGSLQGILTTPSGWPMMGTHWTYLNPDRVAAWDGAIPWPVGWESDWLYADVLAALGLSDVPQGAGYPLAAEWAFMWYKILRLLHIRHVHKNPYSYSGPSILYNQTTKQVTLAYPGSTNYGIYATKCSVALWRQTAPGSATLAKVADYPGPYDLSDTVPIVISVDLGASPVDVMAFLDYNIPGGFTFQ